MKKLVFLSVCFLLTTTIFAQVELVNFEETWKKFLAEPMASGVSKLDKPYKTNTADYLKYCLMTATTHFCVENLKDANELIAEIKSINSAEHDKIPGFTERFKEFLKKMEAYQKVGDLWNNFTKTHSVSTEELNGIPFAKQVCERGTLAKFGTMSAYTGYCKSDVNSIKMDLDRLKNLIEKTGYDPAKVPGLSNEIGKVKTLLADLESVNLAWSNFTSTEKSEGFPREIAKENCNLIPNYKVYILRAMVDLCKFGKENLEKIRELNKTNFNPLPADVQSKVDYLEQEVSKYTGVTAELNQAWNEYVKTDRVSSNLNFKGVFCEKDAQVKSYLLEGLLNPCAKGEEMLMNIEKLRKEYNPSPEASVTERITKLETLVNKEKENLKIHFKAWDEFSQNDTNTVNTQFVYEFCNKEMTIQAYIMDARLTPCLKAVTRVADISKLMTKENPNLGDLTQRKFNDLESRAKNYTKNDKEIADLWKTFISNNDTISSPYQVAEFYCDKINQIKSWCLMGHYNTCTQGMDYLMRIDSFQKLNQLNFDTELACRVTRLRLKVWDCIYWRLVEQAWRETHEERERFGPSSAQIMYKDLNSGKQPCETKVEYEPLGKIGIKYVIKTYLCQDIDLAKMGDPEYYKKIAKWVDTEVLIKYCAPDMRCKTDFTIYIEGHTDGHAFTFMKYKEPLNIPKGYAYTHFLGKSDTIQKTTARELTYDLKSNEELGIGRAWTVKKQLDFMGVPITIGAYEHPANEKGGEFRRLEIELNMPNLLLDFFEKRLKILLEESGIGPQPKNCKS
jgi:hypothetical protein